MDFCATPGTGKEIMWLIDAASLANPATLVSVPTAASTLLVVTLLLLRPSLLLKGKCLRLMLIIIVWVLIVMVFVEQCNLVR